jgi:hypothetical protein
MSSIRSRNRVLVEFVKGTDARSVGDRVYVDPDSAVSLVHKKKVAKIVDEKKSTPVVVPEAPAGDH